MKRSRSIAGIAVLISSIVILGAGFGAHGTIDRLSKAGDAVVRAQQLELDYESLLAAIGDAETGQRGYLLTDDPGYLAPYDAAVRELGQLMESVTARVQVDGAPGADLQPLRNILQLKLAELARTVELTRAGQQDAALAVVRSNQGRELMEDIRSFVGEQVREQQQRVVRLQAIESDALDASVRAGVIVILLAIVLTLLLVYIVRRDSRRVRESENQLAITLRSIGDAVIATDRRGVITMMNPVAERLTGWTAREAVGNPLDETFRIINENNRAAVESPASKVLREGRIVGLANHTLLIRRDQQEIPIEDSGAPILDDTGHVIGVVLVFRDATSERAAKQALHDADRRKDEFLATLAHELRNPLAPIRQAAATAAHPAARDEQVRWSLGVIKRQVSHMARLLDDLLDVSRITRGKLEVRRVRVTLRSIVESAVEMVQPAINAGRHQLSIELPLEPFELEVDPLRIAQVLGNLLTNAARYTPSGGRIRLTAERDGGDVLIHVIDNGIGIEAADLPRIFEMFTQVSATRDRPNAGLGIGLALAKALLQLHDGTIEAKSAGPGQGSEFTVRLALAG